MNILAAAIAGLAVLLSAPSTHDAANARLERAWSTAVRPEAPGTVEPLGIARSDGLVLVEDDRGTITALDTSTGRPRWFVRTPAALRHPPTTHAGRIAFAAGERLFVVDADSGAVLFDEPSTLAPSGAPVAVDDGLFVPSYASQGLVAVSLASGLPTWTLRMPSDPVGPALGTDSGLAVVALANGTLRATTARLDVPRREAWTVRVGDVVGRPVLDGDRLVVSTRAPHVVALDAGSGAQVWIDRPGQAVVSPPIVSSDHDLVVFGLGDGLRAVRRGDGSQVWQTDGSEWPVGFVDPGAVLVRRLDGTSALRDTATGAVLVDGLSSSLLPFGEVLVSWDDGQRVTAQRLVR